MTAQGSPIPDEKRMCHRTGFEKSCRELVLSEKCGRWYNLFGQHPQTGDLVNRFDCMDNHEFLVKLEGNKMIAEQGAALESFRNEIIRRGDAHAFFQLAIIGANPALEAAEQSKLIEQEKN